MMDYCAAEIKIKFPRGWVNSFVLQRSDKVIQTENAPQEEQRSQVPRAHLERTIQDLYDHVHGYVAELVFTLDEVGISDCEDRKTKKVSMSAAMLGQTIHHRVSRHVKHISMIACVLAAGESLLPYIGTSLNSSTVHEHLEKQDVQFGRDFTLQFNQQPSVNAGILLDDIRTVFLLHIDTLRGLAVFAQEVAIRLMDNCSAHVSDHASRLLTDTRMHVITFAPHTTQVFQVPDLTVYGVLKGRLRHELPFDDDDAMLKVIIQVSHDFTELMVLPNV
jgi:hypothetical protein